MKTRAIWMAVLTVVVVLFLGASAEAQLPKQGSYSGIYGWQYPVQATIALEQDHLIWGGVLTGAFRNDAGSGFLHGALVLCTAAGELKKGSVTHDYGDCVATDGDGDKAFWKWTCTACPMTGPDKGEGEWTGGTGKYTGITGHGSYQSTWAAQPGAGWSVWKGNWQLP